MKHLPEERNVSIHKRAGKVMGEDPGHPVLYPPLFLLSLGPTSQAKPNLDASEKLC